MVLSAWFGYRRQWTLWLTMVVTIALVTIATSITHIDLPAGAFGGAVLRRAELQGSRVGPPVVHEQKRRGF